MERQGTLRSKWGVNYQATNGLQSVIGKSRGLHRDWTRHELLRLAALWAMHSDACPPSPSSERFAALVRVLPAVVYSLSPTGAFLSAQRSWQRFTGRTLEQSAGIGWLNAYHEDDRPKLRMRFLGLPPKADTWVAFSRLWCAQTSTYKCMLSRSFFLRDPTSQLPREWLSVDVELAAASSPAAESAPTASALYLSLRSTNAGMFTFVLRSDLGVIIVLLDEAARGIMDPPLPSSMSFDQWLSLIHSDDQPSVRALLSDRTLCSSFPVEFRVRVNGTDRWLQLHGGIQEDGSEEGPRLLSVLSDVTSMIEHEEKRRTSLEEENQRVLEKANTAEELKRQQQEFVDTICHEIRNPLQGIVGAVQMLRDELGKIKDSIRKAQPDGFSTLAAPSFESVYGYLDTIAECTRQQRLITDDVLDLSRLAAGVADVAQEQFPLRRLFSALRVMFAPVAEMRHFTLTMRVVNVSLCSDYGRLSQILSNILSSAVRFTADGSMVLVTATVERESNTTETLRVVIEETNIGINEEQLARLMKTFALTTPHKAGATAGSFGLGLSIARRQLDILRGTVAYSAAVGASATRIVISVPVTNVIEMTAGTGPPPPSLGWSHTRRLPVQLHVLLVEDNVVIRTILERLVRSIGCSYQSAENGAEAVELFKKSLLTFDAVLMDFRMPVMNGIEATRKIREFEQTSTARRARIIGLTGDTRRELKEEAMQAGMDDYLTKPYQRDEVLAALACCPAIANTCESSSVS